MTVGNATILQLDDEKIDLTAILAFQRLSGTWDAERDRVVRARVLRRLARERGIHTDAKALAAAVDDFRIKRRLLHAAAFERWLAVYGVELADVEDYVEIDLLAVELKKTIDREEVESIWREHQSEFDAVDLSAIQVLSEAAAHDAVARARAGTPFPELVQELSIHAETKRKSGRMGLVRRGWVARGRAPAVIAPVFSAKEGEIVGPLRSGRAFWIYEIAAVRSAAKLDAALEDEIRDEILADHVRVCVEEHASDPEWTFWQSL